MIFRLRAEVFTPNTAASNNNGPLKDALDADALHIAAFRSDELVGAVRLTQTPPGTHVLAHLAVKPGPEKAHIAARLCLWCYELSAQAGAFFVHHDNDAGEGWR